MWLVDSGGWLDQSAEDAGGLTAKTVRSKIHLQGLIAQCFPTKNISQNCSPKPEW